MSIKEVSEILRNAKRPINVFGGNSEEEVRKKYRELAKVCHPDLATSEYKDVAEKTTQLLNMMYEKALDEIKKGTYNLISKKDIYKASEPLFEFNFRKKDYSFYEHVCCGDTSDIYVGLLDDELVMLKIASDEADNSLLEEEYKMLSELDHLGVPKPIIKILINGKFGIILRMVDGITFDELKENYGNITKINLKISKEASCLIVGLGNEKSTPDALGPLSLKQVIVTNHLFELGENSGGFRRTFALKPGVTGETGVETSDFIKILLVFLLYIIYNESIIVGGQIYE